MPVYVYRRDDGSTFELEQRMTADALISCPTTGSGVERVLQPFAARYTGTGFYSTDHRKEKPRGRAAADGRLHDAEDSRADAQLAAASTRRRLASKAR